jgi:uncharacterized protein
MRNLPCENLPLPNPTTSDAKFLPLAISTDVTQLGEARTHISITLVTVDVNLLSLPLNAKIMGEFAFETFRTLSMSIELTHN